MLWQSTGSQGCAPLWVVRDGEDGRAAGLTSSQERHIRPELSHSGVRGMWRKVNKTEDGINKKFLLLFHVYGC